MSAAAAPARRGSRSAARAAAAGSSGAEPADPLVVVATEQPRKRPRRAAAAAAAAILEAEGSTDGDTASPAADAGTATAAPQRKGPGRPKQAKLPSTASREFEEELWAQGYKLVAGVDEAGRGPLAGGGAAAGRLLLPLPEAACGSLVACLLAGPPRPSTPVTSRPPHDAPPPARMLRLR